MTAPCPERGTGSTLRPFTQVLLSQQKHSTSVRALRYAVVTPPIIKICVPERMKKVIKVKENMEAVKYPVEQLKFTPRYATA